MSDLLMFAIACAASLTLHVVGYLAARWRPTPRLNATDVLALRAAGWLITVAAGVIGAITGDTTLSVGMVIVAAVLHAIAQCEQHRHAAHRAEQAARRRAEP